MYVCIFRVSVREGFCVCGKLGTGFFNTRKIFTCSNIKPRNVINGADLVHFKLVSGYYFKSRIIQASEQTKIPLETLL